MLDDDSAVDRLPTSSSIASLYSLLVSKTNSNTMVKSKELKIMRKKIEKANKLQDPISLIGKENCRIGMVGGSDKDVSLLCESDLSNDTLNDCLDLFETNMGDMYRSSSWGLDMKEKKEEFLHKNARFLLVKCNSELAAFVNFRFCYDDDDEPENAVLYVYELQVKETYRRQGFGCRLMAISESICEATNLTKVMLTVFKHNKSAMQFYQHKIAYDIDESSPSKHGEAVDYEILSKAMSR